MPWKGSRKNFKKEYKAKSSRRKYSPRPTGPFGPLTFLSSYGKDEKWIEARLAEWEEKVKKRRKGVNE